MSKLEDMAFYATVSTLGDPEGEAKRQREVEWLEKNAKKVDVVVKVDLNAPQKLKIPSSGRK